MDFRGSAGEDGEFGEHGSLVIQHGLTKFGGSPRGKNGENGGDGMKGGDVTMVLKNVNPDFSLFVNTIGGNGGDGGDGGNGGHLTGDNAISKRPLPFDFDPALDPPKPFDIKRLWKSNSFQSINRDLRLEAKEARLLNAKSQLSNSNVIGNGSNGRGGIGGVGGDGGKIAIRVTLQKAADEKVRVNYLEKLKKQLTADGGKGGVSGRDGVRLMVKELLGGKKTPVPDYDGTSATRARSGSHGMQSIAVIISD